MQMRIKLIACGVMSDELRRFLPLGAETEVFEIGLHVRPQSLKAELQAAIRRADGNCDAILLGYGLCSNAVVGLIAHKSRLVVPKVHDCIGVFLGSHRTYLEEMAREPTFFLTRGYIRGYERDHCGPMEEIERMAERHGRKRAEEIVGEMMRPYKRLVYLRTLENADIEADRKYAQEMAARFSMRYEERPGTSELLRRMVEGDWASDFVIVEPGQEVTLEHFIL
jgi:hypothetical protein